MNNKQKRKPLPNSVLDTTLLVQLKIQHQLAIKEINAILKNRQL